MLAYRPISCAQHEQLEFSVLRKIPLLLEYRDGTEKICHIVLPLDVETRDSAEWLKFKQQGEEAVMEIRLDAIISVAEAGCVEKNFVNPQMSRNIQK